MNEKGEVVGSYVCGLNDAVPFYWSLESGFVILKTPDWFSEASTARGISDEGTIVGSFQKAGVGQRAFHYKDGVWTELPPVDPASGWSVAHAVSPDGSFVVGRRSITSEINPYNAFIWDAKTAEFTDLGVMNGPNSEALDISRTGHVVGWTGASTISEGTGLFVYTDKRLDVPGPAPGALFSVGWAVNAYGKSFCSGVTSLDPVTSSPFTYTEGEWIEVAGLKGAMATGPADINDLGETIGTASIDGVFHACTWSNGLAYDLNELIPADIGLELTGGRHINNTGQILCGAHDGDNNPVGVLLTPLAVQDLDGDCQVGPTDLALLLLQWGPSPDSAADFDSDGVVGPSDLAMLLAAWG
jgi:probable HAF family extracellular repeat protein